MSFDGLADFDARVLAPLQASAFFRLAPDGEIDASYAAYRSGDIGELLRVWQNDAAATRVHMPRANRRAFDRAHFAPEVVNGLAFLATVRAALEAGVRFRARLRPEVRQAFAVDFPWLEHRHEHVPPGWAPRCEFPPAIDPFFDLGTVDEAKARWQLVAALNEVMQSVYTEHLALLLALPVLATHASRERELAFNYFAHWSPPATRELWRQSILVLDGINAAVFEAACDTQLVALVARSLVGGVSRRGEWRRFVAALDEPQQLVSAG